MVTEPQAWAVLDTVMDPEVPVLSVRDLGIVRDVRVTGTHVDVAVTPTYTGCPATEVIAGSIREALLGAGATSVCVETRLSPPWTTDWLAPGAAERLTQHGIAPPCGHDAAAPRPVRLLPRCPRCGAGRTEELSRFGATACKALFRCLVCREPFEYFKAI